MYFKEKLLFFTLLSAISLSQVKAQIEMFSSGEPISVQKINQNYDFIKNEMSKFNVLIPFYSFSDGELIKSNNFNYNLSLISNIDPNLNLTPVDKGDILNSGLLNNIFSQFNNRLNSLWLNVNSCDQLVESSRYLIPGQYLIDPDGIGNAIPKTYFCDNTSKTKQFYPIKQVNNYYVLDNGSNTDFLIQFMQHASTSSNSIQFSGTYNLKHGETEINTEMIERSGGVHDSTNYCDLVADSKMCMVRFRGNTTLNGTHTTSVRKKGLVFFVDGDLTINGTISMTARGANAVGQNVAILPGKSIAAYGGAGGSRFNAGAAYATTYANNGSAGINGAGGGGGAGAAGRHSGYSTQSGAGSQGTSWSGGSGGGGACSRTGNSIAGDAQPNGGSGGIGVGNWDWTVYGGAGNPGGAKNGDWTVTGSNGTGGTIILIVNGDLQINGAISAHGVSGYTGGSSGGGSINVFYKGTKTGSGTISALGGERIGNCGNAYAGNGGNGSVTVSTY